MGFRSHSFESSRVVEDMVLATLAVLISAAIPMDAQQIPDTAYTPPIASPHYPVGKGPNVVVDAAHLNFHTADGRYLTFANLLRRDGYRVGSNDEPFTATVLAGIDILVIANAMHEQSEMDFAPLPSLSAFTDPEIAAVDEWVRRGGSLLLIADHMPIAGHTEALAAAFGVRFHNGFVFDSVGSGRVTFRRVDNSLRSNAVSDGRRAGERVDSVTAFTGQAFRIDPGVDADPLLVLSPSYTMLLPSVAWEFSESTPRIPAAYLLQGALVRHGAGSVAVFGEAAMFSAQLAGRDRQPMGMNDPTAGQNARLVLNLLQWLSSHLR